jgi:virginiamycin B lyase
MSANQTQPSSWSWWPNYPDPGGFGANVFTENGDADDTGLSHGYKTTERNFPIILSGVSYDVDNGIKSTGSYFHGNADSSIGELTKQSSYFAIALAGSRSQGPPFPGRFGYIDHTAPYMSAIGNKLRIIVSGIRVVPGSDDVLQIYWAFASDEYLQQWGINAENSIFLSSANGESAFIDFEIPRIDPRTAQPVSTVAPNLVFQTVNYSTHKLEFDIKISDLTVWPDQPIAPVPAPPGPAPTPPSPPNDLLFSNFNLPTPDSRPISIASGPDGNLWFTLSEAIGRIDVNGRITEFAVSLTGLGTIISDPKGGVLWFTATRAIASITVSGHITIYPIEGGAFIGGLAVSDDGAVWFLDSDENYVCRMPRLGGTISKFRIPTAYSIPYGLALGRDGSLWFCENQASKIARMTPGGSFTEYELARPSSHPICIVAGFYDEFWFVEQGEYGKNDRGRIGRISKDGTIVEFTFPADCNAVQPTTIVADRRGGVWFADNSWYGDIHIVRMQPDGAMKTYTSEGNAGCFGITLGGDGAIWFTENVRNKIGRLGRAID